MPKAVVHYPPHDPQPQYEQSLFLAGSIDMGKAEAWQKRVISALGDLPIDIFNPRRDDYDPSWVQDISDDNFRGQVEWELAQLSRADKILVYLSPDGPAPISLLEIGLFARTGKLIVCCPKGYWRRGNVQIVCRNLKIPLFDDLDEAVLNAKLRLPMWAG